MAITKKTRKCGGCGGHCGGRLGNCKFAANEAKRRADAMWSYAIGRASAKESGDQASAQSEGDAS